MVEQKQEIKAFFRVLNTDLEGAKPIVQALTKVHGVSFSLANAICNSLQIPKNKKAGSLTEPDARKIESFMKELKFPKWMFNRRFDPDTGVDKHLLGADLKFTKDNDIKMMRKIKTYKGLRHSLGQPVRGQRTRSHFRKGSAVGVMKQKLVAPAKKEGAKK